MKIVLYSDLQLHNYHTYAVFKDGISSRLDDHFKVLDAMLEYAQTHGISHVFFAGDCLEAREKVEVVTLKKMLEWKNKVGHKGIEQVDLVGNHDLIAKSTLHSTLDLFDTIPMQQIVRSPQWVVKDNIYGIYCIPYMNDYEIIKKALIEVEMPPGLKRKNCIAIIHYGLFDVRDQYGRVIQKYDGHETVDQININQLNKLLDCVENVFFGHYHITRSITPRIHFIGTPIQHNWGEAGVQTRFLEVDLERGTFEAVPTQAPQFVVLDKLEDLERNMNNFCRLKVKTEEDRGHIEKIIQEKNLNNVEVLYIKESLSQEKRLDIDLGMTFEKMAEIMLDNDPVSLDKNRLKTIMLNVFAQAKESLIL